MGMFFHSADAPPERPADPALRRANMRRIGPLFAPYKLRLGGVLLLIVASAGLGVVPAFLLKHVLEAIGRNDTTSIASSVTTVGATMVGMLVLNWKLALFAFALIPFFVLLTRRVGNERRRIAKTTQETLADISSLVQESLSVSGILLGKTMGRGKELADRFEGDSRRLADLEVRQRMAGRWVMASIQTSFAIMPAAVYR